ncbi:hypothetical protein [Endozoicomonas sp. 8E]|uniref:hypothetical protein n=1 Tax=Endozoicomonas sp. 8E TaxID=3035692 RepID=UPI002938E25A|nr:hypothetical protein [Endozoicomonas sp. 8E]WOG27248.1 hypothetical protein P6910_22290 [Endozoicomonas sp. 8E]
MLLQKGKKGSIVRSPVLEWGGLQPDKGTVFSAYPFELNRFGNENKKQTKTGSQSPPPQQERKSKKQHSEGQGSSGSSGSGSGAALASGNDEGHARYLEKLKEILKATEKSLKTMDQKKNIDDFIEEVKKFYAVNPGILEDKGSLENSQYRWKAILSLLQLYFPGKLEDGEMTHVLLDYPKLKSLPVNLIKFFAKAVLPDLELPEELPDDELVGRVLDAASTDIIKLMHIYIGFPQCLYQLVALFITELPLMAAEEPKNYIFQVKTGHISVFSIRRNSKGHYRVFVADSLNVFKHYNDEQTYSPLPHFVALALTLAIKYHGFTDSRFYFFPQRQVSRFGCESFVFHDLETLLKSPMLADNGYYSEKEPLTKEKMLRFFLQIMYLEGSEQLGRLVINGEDKDFIDTVDKPAFDKHDLEFLAMIALRNWKEWGLESDLVKLYQLRQFPLRFAYLTQGQHRLKRLLEGFSEECQQEVNQVIDQTRGLLSVNDGTCHNNVNLAATLMWMQMNIDLLDKCSPGQKK